MVSDKRTLDYHSRQFKEPYRSTVAFCDWLEERNIIGPEVALNIVDACCGHGANIDYMGKRYPKSNFHGFDIDREAIDRGCNILRENLANNCTLECNSLKDFDGRGYDGVICLQTFSWLSNIHQPLEQLCNMGAGWIAFSSLFYDGPVSCEVRVTEHPFNDCPTFPKKSYYNIYSIDEVCGLLKNFGYSRIAFKPFEIDIDLEKPSSGLMGTYTQKLENGHRIQISGPLLMTWYFFTAEKI
ncbi:MAG: hypothetical protein A2173_03780 [Planctomycetes bacterium RBG_13_44_8b]|nr:MAG: hypothetical protein A2173_03780 [Planctomycetes bacterium RBG_13_44_8b]